MARKQEPTKPLFPLQHEFFASLKKYQEEVLMLTSALESVLDMTKNQPELMHEKVIGILRTKVDAVKAAAFD